MSAKLQWQQDLLKLQLRYIGAFPQLFSDNDEKMIQHILDEFKEKYPGNFSLRWKYDNKRGLMFLVPKFEKPEEETFWKLKYSN